MEGFRLMDIPIARTEFIEKDLDLILEPLRSGWIVQGKYVQEFEQKWSEYTGAKHSIATTSCTTALHLSLAALGITYGDEVIVPAFTWIATANAVVSLGAKPLFCDIELRTFNIDVAQIQDRITPATKAIIPVHLFGLAADMDPLIETARRYDLRIVEDAACGFGAFYKNSHVGCLGDAGCFSFHPRKAITTGEGGMITTNNKRLADRLRSMRDHGAAISDLQRHNGSKPYLLPDFPYAGFNYRMTDIQATLGCSQMERAMKIQSSRMRIARKYDAFFSNIPWLRPPCYKNEFVHGYQSYVCLFQPEEINLKSVARINKQRNVFMDYLQKNGVSTRPGTHAVHLLKYYREKYDLEANDFPNAYISDQCSIAFPIFPSLSEQELDYIFSTIQAYNLN